MKAKDGKDIGKRQAGDAERKIHPVHAQMQLVQAHEIEGVKAAPKGPNPRQPNNWPPIAVAIIRHQMVEPIGNAGEPRRQAAGQIHLPAKEQMRILHLSQGTTFDPQLLIGAFVVFYGLLGARPFNICPICIPMHLAAKKIRWMVDKFSTVKIQLDCRD